MTGRLKSFILESRREFMRINWPTRKEAIDMVIVVIGVSLLMAAFLGALDFLFLQGIEELIVNL